MSPHVVFELSNFKTVIFIVVYCFLSWFVIVTDIFICFSGLLTQSS
jgi:hypothetical protein